MHNVHNTFLSGDDSDRFVAEFVQRSVEEITAPWNTTRRSRTSTKAIKLTTLVKKHLESYRADDSWQEALLIRSYKDDGITWACEEVARTADASPDWNTVQFVGSNDPNSLPEIAHKEPLSQQRLIKDALKTGLIRMPPFWLTWQCFLSVAVASILVLIASWASEKFHWNEPLAWLLYVIVSVCTVVPPLLVKSVQLQTNPKPLLDRLNELRRGEEPKEWQNLVQVTAIRFLNKCSKKLIVIDDFTKLDALTRAVLLRVMGPRPIKRPNSIVWAIFDPFQERELFGLLAATPSDKRRQLLPGCNFTCYKLRFLNSNEKIALLVKRGMGMPEAKCRADEVDCVKHLVQSAVRDQATRLEEIWTSFVTTCSENDNDTLGTADLFKFLVVNGANPDVMLTDKQLGGIFAEKTSDKAAKNFADLLSSYFDRYKGIPLAKAENALATVRTRLSAFLINSDMEDEMLQVARGSQWIIEKVNAGRIPYESIHLFWLVYWSSRWREPGQITPSRLRELHRHATRALVDDRLLRSASGRRMCNKALEAMVWVALQCAYRTQFQYALGAMKTLILNVDILDRSSPGKEALSTFLPKISDSAWITYAVSRSYDLLSYLARSLPTRAQTQDSTGKPAAAELAGIKFYLQLNNLDPDLHAAGATRIRESAKRDKWALKRLMDYMEMHTAEFLYHCEAVGVKLSSIETQRNFFSLGSKIIQHWQDEIYQPSSNKDEELSVFNYQNEASFLRLLTRCKRFDEAEKRILRFLQVHETETENPFQDRYTPLLDRVLFLEGLAASMESFCRGLWAQNSFFLRESGPSGFSWLKQLEALTTEERDLVQRIFSVLSQNHFSDQPSTSSTSNFGFRDGAGLTSVSRVEQLQDLTAEQRDILQRIFSLLGQNHVSDQPLTSKLLKCLVSKTGELYLQIAMVWEEFGLNELRDEALVRRAGILLDTTCADPKSVLESLSGAMTSKTSIGLLARLIMTNCFRPLRDLWGACLSNCAIQVLSGNFPDDLKLAFGAAALDVPRVNKQASLIVEKVIDLLNSPGVLDQAEVRHQCASGLLHDLLQTTWIARRTKLFASILALGSRLELQIQGEDRRALNIFLRYHRLISTLDEGPRVSWKEVLMEWDDARDHWLYAALLCRALKADEHVIVDCFEYLEYQPKPARSSAEIHLIHDLCEKVKNNKLEEYRNRCCLLLLQSVRPVLGNWSCECALQTYRLLSYFDPGNGVEYSRQQDDWTARKLERDLLEKLRALVEEGHYWRVFETFLDSLYYYQFPHRCQNTIFREQVAANTAMEWIRKQDKNDIESLFRMTVEEAGTRIILEEFVAFGHLVFDTADSDDFIHDMRKRLDQETERQMSDFFRIIAETETIPKVLREIIERRRNDLSIELA